MQACRGGDDNGGHMPGSVCMGCRVFCLIVSLGFSMVSRLGRACRSLQQARMSRGRITCLRRTDLEGHTLVSNAHTASQPATAPTPKGDALL